MNRVASILIGALLATASGCGSSGGNAPTADAGAKRAEGRLVPWAVDNSWTYLVTAGSAVGAKVTTIGALESVGGTGANADKMANRVVTIKKDGKDQTVSWAADLDDKIVKYREQSYDVKTMLPTEDDFWEPFKLEADDAPEHNEEGASWLEDYEETKVPVGGTPVVQAKRDRWTLKAVAETVTVPAGTFRAVVFEKVGSSTKTFYFAPKVGKIKEEEVDQTEELVSFTLSP
jgi:hypothetical protein